MDVLVFFWFTLAMTVLAAATQWLINHRRASELRALAALWHMHYAADDRFRLAHRVSSRLPATGAAGVRAWNLIYGADAGRRAYLFIVEYGIGAIGSQRRYRRVAMLDEPASEATADQSDTHLMIAPEDLPVIEQYRYLHQRRGSPM
jgi:hypothetical protein